jgi:hypothetical protein
MRAAAWPPIVAAAIALLVLALLVLALPSVRADLPEWRHPRGARTRRGT